VHAASAFQPSAPQDRIILRRAIGSRDLTNAQTTSAEIGSDGDLG
jgi:hypothetical protein